MEQTRRSTIQAQAMQQRTVALQMQASLAQPGFLGYMHQQLPPAFSNHFMPAQLPAFAVRPANAQPLSAAGQSIGAAVLTDPEERAAKRRKRSAERGRDSKPRARPRCRICLDAGRVEECKECPGRVKRALCPYL